MMPTVAEAIAAGADRLASVADNPRLEARILLAHTLGIPRDALIRDPGRRVVMEAYDRLLARRLAREPIALIIGHREFWSMDLLVSPATLIPRPDSETLIEAALALPRPPPRRILDLGTGTGCLLLALLQEFPDAYGVGVDLSAAAAALARANAQRTGLLDRASFAVSDWSNCLAGRFDLIVSNPPYIARGDLEHLMPEVARHEPRLALDGGVDGYDAYRTILPQLRAHLEKDGTAVLELGEGQADVVAGLADQQGFAVALRRDLAGIPRAMVVSPGS